MNNKRREKNEAKNEANTLAWQCLLMSSFGTSFFAQAFR